jgi:phosphoserine phosphatase
VAREIQMRFLPRDPVAPSGYDLAGWSRPADETGGDTFDIITVGEKGVILLLGDATGHGVGPALSVTQVRSMLRMGVRLGADLDDTFRHINDQLSEDLAPNRFVTAFLGMLDAGAHRVTYHAGGQAPLLWFHAAEGLCEWLDASTIPLGMMPTLRPRASRSFEMAPGDIIGLLTDGIFEYQDRSGELFGEERVGALVIAHGDAPMAGLVERIVSEVEAFAGGAPQNDDMTILLVRRLRV